MFENVDNTHTHTDERTTEAYVFYKLTNEPKGSGELKMACAPCEDSDQPGHSPMLISLRCPHEKSLGP